MRKEECPFKIKKVKTHLYYNKQIKHIFLTTNKEIKKKKFRYKIKITFLKK